MRATFGAAICWAVLLGGLPASWADSVIDVKKPQITQTYVDMVWVANRVGFALRTVGRQQFVAYYDSSRMMTVASRDVNSDQWGKTILPSKLMWDSHNSVALGIDEAGYIHVSGNMHTHPVARQN